MEKDQKDMIGEIIEAFEKYAGHQAFVINNINCLKLYIKYPL